ncbi:CD276 antigen-like [Hippocampus comes]|uniref:CD276 antigen-like n=1 Tax=Hippocampus comes TaxID=109280 RepID=UPI00094E84F1|nr:PREDICTED: CD276 antigen-like [Hippocampus comes]
MRKPKRTMIMKTRMAVLTLVVALLWHLVIGNVSDVRCRWNTSCLLEANFSIGDDVAIYWIQFPEILVHSFFFETDRLKKQDKRFRGRTSLFKENIGKGNASLLLKDVVVGDEGSYMCRVVTLTGISDSFVNLHIEGKSANCLMYIIDASKDSRRLCRFSVIQVHWWYSTWKLFSRRLFVFVLSMH